MVKNNIIIFDLETNGFEGSSVLSICAILAQTWINEQNIRQFKEIQRLSRFYYPKEDFNQKALAVNGLSERVINLKRSHETYPEHFLDDLHDLKVFFGKAHLYVSHNFSFDSLFIPFSLNNWYCTMRNLTNYCAIDWSDYYQSYKWPKLYEAAETLNIPYSQDQLHGAEADAELCFAIFSEMSNMDEFSSEISSKLI